MTMNEVKALRCGDQVKWNDPDRDACSRFYTIQSIEIDGGIVVIRDTDGDTLECFPRELE